MKSIRQICVFVYLVALATIAHGVSAQEIGSYQSILSRAGYQNSDPLVMQQAVNSGESAAKLPTAQKPASVLHTSVNENRSAAITSWGTSQAPVPPTLGTNFTTTTPDHQATVYQVQSSNRKRGLLNHNRATRLPRTGRVTFENAGFENTLMYGQVKVSQEPEVAETSVQSELGEMHEQSPIVADCVSCESTCIESSCNTCDGAVTGCKSVSCGLGVRLGCGCGQGGFGLSRIFATSSMDDASVYYFTPSMDIPASDCGISPVFGGAGFVSDGAISCRPRPVVALGQRLKSSSSRVGDRIQSVGSRVAGATAQTVEQGTASGTNLVSSLFGVFMRRDYEDSVPLAFDGSGNAFSSNDIEHGDMSGFGFSLAGRNCDRTGWEAIYWEVDEWDRLDVAGPSTTALAGLASVYHTPAGANVWAIYNAGSSAYISRESDIDNFEFNLLRNGGSYTTRTGNSATYELIGGFRLFRFDEALRYISNSTAAGYPAVMNYDVEVDNTLAGIHVGGRSEIFLGSKVRLAYGGNIGIFNNRIESRQEIYDDTGYNPDGFNYFDEKDDAAMLGQFDVGLVYGLSAKSQLRVGYRALGVAGVALAANQYPADFTDTNSIQSARSNGNLLMHGLYFGSELCY